MAARRGDGAHAAIERALGQQRERRRRPWRRRRHGSRSRGSSSAARRAMGIDVAGYHPHRRRRLRRCRSPRWRRGDGRRRGERRPLEHTRLDLFPGYHGGVFPGYHPLLPLEHTGLEGSAHLFAGYHPLSSGYHPLPEGVRHAVDDGHGERTAGGDARDAARREAEHWRGPVARRGVGVAELAVRIRAARVERAW